MGGLTEPRPLTREHDTEAFDCGRASLNQWLRRRAWPNQDAGVSRTSVVLSGDRGAIAGFVTLAAGEIARSHLPKRQQRNRPDPIPIVLLGQLAVDSRHQGSGLARSLLAFAFWTSLRVSEEVGCWGVVTHPLDEDARSFYARFGFMDLPYDPRRSMVVRVADLKASGF